MSQNVQTEIKRKCPNCPQCKVPKTEKRIPTPYREIPTLDSQIPTLDRGLPTTYINIEGSWDHPKLKSEYQLHIGKYQL